MKTSQKCKIAIEDFSLKNDVYCIGAWGVSGSHCHIPSYVQDQYGLDMPILKPLGLICSGGRAWTSRKIKYRDHFITLQEYRKQKLDKINGSNL
jgi:hypothetical protein